MADLTLYSISNELEYLCDLIDKDVLSEEEEQELTRIITAKLQNSGEEIIKFFKSNSAYIDGVKAEIADLQERKKKAENREAIIKERLTQNMKRMGLKKLQTAVGAIVVPNRVDISIDVVDLDKVPEKYKKIKTEVSVDKTAVKNYFKETGEILPGINVIEKEGKVQLK